MTCDAERPRGRILRWLVSRKVRAVLCLGVFAAPAMVGTMASWTVDATIAPGGFTFGKLDLTVGATAVTSIQLPGTGGEYEYSAITISNLLPGESIARPFAVKNSGDAGFTYNGSVFTINNQLVAAGSGLRVAIFSGGTPTETGSEATGNRTGNCPGGELLKNQAVSTSTNNVKVAPTDILLVPGATQSHCVRVLLRSDSPSTMQGKLTQITIKLNAKQVDVP